MKPLCLYLLTGACALVLLASFATWMTFKMAPALDLDGNLAGMDPTMASALQQAMRQQMAQAMQEHMTADGWKGHVTLMGVTLENWMVPVSALAIALLAWLRATAAWETPRWLGIALASLCVVHLATLLVVVGANQATVRFGFGALLATVGSVAMLGLTVFAPEPEEEWTAVGAGRSGPHVPLGRVQPYMD